MSETTTPVRDAAERRFGRTVTLLVAAGFGALLLMGVMAAFVMERLQNRAEWVAHSYQVEGVAKDIRLSLERMRSGRRGTLLRLTPTMRATYDDAAATLNRDIDRAARLTRDNPVQQALAVDLRREASRLEAMMTASLDAGGVDAAQEAELQARGLRVAAISGRMLAVERRLLNQREADRQAVARNFYLVMALAAALLVAVGAGSILVIRRYTGALNASRAELAALNADLEGAVEERTVDLQRANDEIQRFAYIVSHDLRSPLVNVMGFTAELEAAAKSVSGMIERVEAEAPDLVTTDARLAAREDLPEAIGFIRTSTQKMDRLINAILRLSREGRRTIAPERLDMAALARGAIDTLRVRTEEAGAEIAIRGRLPDITSDRLAVDQILSNLLENAIKYLKPGVPGRIAVSGKVAGPRVLIEVADNGRGIDPRDHDRIFDLFRRSGQQDKPGEGIGLAHVRAQAYRIGGTISVRSALDEGATFVINLPRTFAGGQGALS